MPDVMNLYSQNHKHSYHISIHKKTIRINTKSKASIKNS